MADAHPLPTPRVSGRSRVSSHVDTIELFSHSVPLPPPSSSFSNSRTLPTFTSTFLTSPLTGVDASTVVVGNYPKLGAQGIASACLTAKTHSAYAVLIQGSKGDIRIPPMLMNPSKFTLELKGEEPKTIEFPIPGHG